MKGTDDSQEDVQMADKYMRKCSPSLAIKEMQIKSTLRFHLTPVSVSIIKKTTDVGEDGEGKRSPHTVGGNVN
jgi:hypothetical protein